MHAHTHTNTHTHTHYTYPIIQSKLEPNFVYPNGWGGVVYGPMDGGRKVALLTQESLRIAA